MSWSSSTSFQCWFFIFNGFAFFRALSFVVRSGFTNAAAHLHAMSIELPWFLWVFIRTFYSTLSGLPGPIFIRGGSIGALTLGQ